MSEEAAPQTEASVESTLKAVVGPGASGPEAPRVLRRGWGLQSGRGASVNHSSIPLFFSCYVLVL